MVLTIIFSSCKHSVKIQKNESDIDTLKTVVLPPLLEGEYTLAEKDFGEVIELQGISHPVDEIFKVSECEIIAIDSLLIMKNRQNPDMFTLYSLPSLKFIKSFGRAGNGPGEFRSPHLVKDESGEYLCFIFEMTNSNLYALNKELEIIELPTELKKGENTYDDKQLYGISSKNLIYVESTRNGKAIFHLTSKGDSTSLTLLKDLSFSDKQKSWAAYIGDLGVNGKNNRVVFAYKYFKRLMFLDTKNNTSRILNFETSDKTKTGNAVAMLAPSNVTYYWGMSSQNKYVYVLYSGRTPIDVSQELKSSSGYIYVEKFDWNGNPISKYKLDHWGYFCVNNQENTIYLVSTTDEQPFYSYKLP